MQIVEAVTWQLDMEKTLEHDSRGPFSYFPAVINCIGEYLDKSGMKEIDVIGLFYLMFIVSIPIPVYTKRGIGRDEAKQFKTTFSNFHE